MKRHRAPESLPDHLKMQPASRDDIRVPWIRDGWYWGPACPQEISHGALIDLKGTNKWYCRHSAHIGRGVYTEDVLVDLEWGRVSSAALSPEKSQDQLEVPEP